MSPLHTAAADGNVDCVKAFLAHGADPNLIDLDGKVLIYKVLFRSKILDITWPVSL